MVDLRRNAHLLDDKDCVVYAHMSGNKLVLAHLFPLVRRMYGYASVSFVLLAFTAWVIFLSVAVASSVPQVLPVAWWLDPVSIMMVGSAFVVFGLLLMVQFLALCGRTFSYYLSPNWTSLLPPKLTMCMIKTMRKSLAERVNIQYYWVPVAVGFVLMSVGSLMIGSVPSLVSILMIVPLLYAISRIKINCERGRLILARRMGLQD